MDAGPHEKSVSGSATVARGDARADRHQDLVDAALRQVEAAAGSHSAVAVLRDTLRGYRIVGELRRGGQGVVYRGVQESTGRDVAIKVMHGCRVSRPASWLRFEREIKVLARLRHPHIVAIHDSVVVGDIACLIMDFIHGVPLDQWMQNPRHLADIRQILACFATICDAANAAHLRGIIHRDLKPSNVLIDADGAPHVLDFGLAKLVGESDGGDDQPSMTQTGQFIGSLPWASPEQADGQHDRVDVRTDVYSLGVMLYQLLTGSFPYPVTGGVRSVVENIVHAEPPRPSRRRAIVGGELDAIVLKCLQKEPERRYQTAGELARDVRRYLAGEPVEAKCASGFYVLRKSVRRHRAALAVVTGFVALLVGSSVAAWSLYAQAVRARAVAHQQKAEATERLWESYLAQARAARTGDQVGRRFDSLAALAHAGRIRADVRLRDEAVACLILPDLRRGRAFENVTMASAFGLRTLDRFACEVEPGVLEVRRMADGALLRRLTGPALTARLLVFSPDGRFLAAKLHDDDDERLWVWHVPTERAVLKLEGEAFAGGGMAVAGGATGGLVAATNAMGQVDCYALPSGAPHATLAPAEPPGSLALSPDGTRLAIAARDVPRLSIWDVAPARQRETLETPARLYRIAWSPDGQRLAGPGWEYDVYVWRADTWALEQVLSGHRAPVVDALFHPERPLLATWSWDDTTRLWDLASGRAIFEPIEELRCVGFDGSLALRGYDDATLGHWRYHDDSPQQRLTAPARFDVLGSADVHAGGRWLVTSGRNGVWLWDLARGRRMQRLTEQEAWTAVFAPELRSIVAVVEDGVVRWPVVDAGSGEPVVGAARQVWAETGLNEAWLLADGRRLAVCGAQVRILDLESGGQQRAFDGAAGMERPSVSPDGRWAFTGSWHGEAAHVWDAETGESVAAFPGRSVRGRFSPDGRWLVLTTGAAHRFLDVGTWRVHHEVPRRRQDYRLAGPIAFSRDGRMTAVMHSRYEARLLETATGRPLVTLPNPELLGIMNMTFSPAGDRIILVTTSDTLLVWDLAAIRTELRQLGLDWEQARDTATAAGSPRAGVDGDMRGG